MNIKKLNDAFAVAGQIAPSEMQAVADQGYRTVICNRPDNEVGPDTDFAAVRAAATAAGMAIHYIPIIPGQAGLPEVQATADLLKTAQGPVLAFCRSGARSTAIYEAAQTLPK